MDASRRLPWAILAAVLCLGIVWGSARWLRRNTYVTTRSPIDHIVLSTCPADVSELEFGSFCKEPSSGKIRYRGTLEVIP